MGNRPLAEGVLTTSLSLQEAMPAIIGTGLGQAAFYTLLLETTSHYTIPHEYLHTPMFQDPLINGMCAGYMQNTPPTTSDQAWTMPRTFHPRKCKIDIPQPNRQKHYCSLFPTYNYNLECCPGIPAKVHPSKHSPSEAITSTGVLRANPKLEVSACGQ